VDNEKVTAGGQPVEPVKGIVAPREGGENLIRRDKK
jgi:hypothetical protein